MGCATSCVRRATMALFGKNSNNNNNNDDVRAILERKLYIAKESPEPDFDLSDCQLKHIPSGTFTICKVYRKEFLYLQNNNLQSLEEGGHLSDLYLIRVLNISHNKFSHIPNEIRYLVNLTELYVQDNQIKNIPDDINHLQNLQVLNLSNNRLKTLTPSLGQLKNLKRLFLTGNEDLTKLCPELCLANNLLDIELDVEQLSFPPAGIAIQGTSEIMKFLCLHMNMEYIPASSSHIESTVQTITVQSPSLTHNPFVRQSTMTWEEQEAAIIEQENRIHKAAKEQREQFLSKVLQEQLELDSEIARVHEARELERQRLIKSIQEDEKEIECLVKNFIQSDYLKPEIIQQQLAHEQAEHDRLLEITRQNYDNVKKTDVFKAMEMLIEEDSAIQHSKKHYENSLMNIKENLLMQDLEGADKVAELLKMKDDSRIVLVQQLLEDQDIQKAIVASLLERVDARSWSLNQEISLISFHLAKLSVIEQEKKKLQISYNYNELLQQRFQLVQLLDDLFDQRNKRKKQLIETMKEIETMTDKSSDFWLKNYQKLVDSAPRTLLDVGKCLDPVLANYLLQEGVIHCLPFLVKFLFSDELLTDVTLEKLKDNGVSLKSDRENIIIAINKYIEAKTQNSNDISAAVAPSAPIHIEEENLTGVVTNPNVDVLESECVICMDARCEVVFIPCGHMCCCQLCAEKEIQDCPMCRSSIERNIKVIVS